ncbi:Sphingosine hydroxylase [Mycena sanguinolenta]|uniref:Sphingosine hydroxylase n=1 Tax=Mycena sanguinolenta TaxID=230812 RepID=A0A8H7DF46_9AGAR|nr:Sphingosine hydroxylase [Mycena sanguinolenta]
MDRFRDPFASPPMNASTDVPWYYSSKPSLVDGVADHYVALAAPFVAYWALSLFFHYLDTRDWKALEKYRIHDSAEVASRNRVSRTAVIWTVIFQQVVQTALGLFWLSAEHSAVPDHAGKVAAISRQLSLVLGSGEYVQSILPSLGYYIYWWAIPVLQFLVAIFTIDTWQYFLHRSMHMNKFLYRHFHSWHHRLYVPYAFGALYNHPFEGFLLDSLGAVIAESVSGMTTRQAALLFSIATLKTVDDHCGYRFPFDPLQVMSSNNADYHDIHHQQIGIKSNFAQPFFVHWDVILSTQMTRQEMERRKQNNRSKTE